MSFEIRSRALVIKLIIVLILLLVIWTVISSLVFLEGTGLASSFSYPFYQWWLYFIYEHDDAVVFKWLKIGAIAGAAADVILIVTIITVFLKSGNSLKRSLFNKSRSPLRGATSNHGHADWMSMKQALQLFSGPSREYGGIAIGEAYRVDQDKSARMQFIPKDKKSWGQGGKAQLLIDACENGSTHSLVFAGPGSFKSTSAITTMVTWTGSSVVLDPSTEIGPMLRSYRESLGHKVHELQLDGDVGFNVLDWIDINSPEVITNIQDVVSWICPESKGANQSGDDFFDRYGKNLITCILAHMLYDPITSKEEKTLRTLRALVCTPQNEMRTLLKGIHERSASATARQLAGGIMGLVEETFSGVYGNADNKTAWLSDPSLANLVSGNSFHSSDLTNGKVDIFVQLPLRALENCPEVGRTIIGALLNTVYEADGKAEGRVLYLLDEVARLGPMKIMAIARDAGRKYGITLRLLYQSVGQLEEQWGREGKRAWYDAAVHRTYVAISDLETAKELSESFGQYGVIAASAGSSKGNHNAHGTNVSYQEIARSLIRPEELLNDARVDEAFIVVRGGRPLRCGVPIYFRRPEISAKISANRFSKAQS